MIRERDINRIYIISAIIVSVLIISLIGVFIGKMNRTNNEDNFAKDLSIVEQEDLDTESTSTQLGKKIEESKDEEFEEAELVENTTNKIEEANQTKTTKEVTKTSEKEEKKEENKDTEKASAEVEKEKKMEFETPLKGEILREFAKDSLVFSNTLQEWITHTGVDIKADKTSVVKAAEAGTVSAIKNDPRYGLTVIINHDNGYQTIYSNLLTSEFVVKGEKVEKGQSIGTVGNSASFESSDDYHLHFELLKNNEYLDPNIYMSFE